jgi:hypothetical protein
MIHITGGIPNDFLGWEDGISSSQS